MSLEAQLQEAVDGELEWVQELIGQGADVNARGAYGMTVLMHAVSGSERDPAIVRLLIDSGADVNATTPDGYAALHSAIDVCFEANEPECVRGILKALIDAGADLEAKQHWGWTPLVRAVLGGSDLEVEVLLEYGADPFVTGFLVGFYCPQGSTLLHAAATNPTKLRMLIDAGLDLDALTNSGQTVLDIARDNVVSNERSLNNASSAELDKRPGAATTMKIMESAIPHISELPPGEAEAWRLKMEELVKESTPTNRETENLMLENARACVNILERAMRVGRD